MKIRLLGTGAADGIPALFADSRVSQHARTHGGKDLRTRCGALLDDVLKIDFPPDTFVQVARDQLNPIDWGAIFFTHSHDDHLATDELQYALYPFTECEFAPFVIFGNTAVCEKIETRYPKWPFELVQTRSFEPVQWLGYTVTPIKANHKLDEDSQNLLISDGNKTLLYGTDTGIWHEETWEFLSDYQIDLLIIECTEGFVPTCYYGHLDVTECLQVVSRMREMRLLKDGASIVTTHHSHAGDATHEQLEKALRLSGVEPGYDGLEILI